MHIGQMSESAPRARLAAGEHATWVMAPTADPFVIEALALAGFDAIVLDLEHAPIDDGQAQGAIRAAEAFGLPVLARITLADSGRYGRFLDAGGAGIVVAHVSTRAELDAVVSLTRLPPAGRRGAGAVRVSGHGSIPTRAEWAREQNERVIVAAQVEDRAGVELAGEIAARDGIDAIVMGPRDLSFDLGVPGDVSHPTVLEAIERVRAACAEHGAAYGTTARPDATRDPEVAIGMVNVAALIRHGASVVTSRGAAGVAG
jgi:2-keto-3-deoxy-L-rhamnonate aldolase RhmA